MRKSSNRYPFFSRTKMFVIGSCCVFPPVSVKADERRFTLVYEAATLGKGVVEVENWATWKTGPKDDRSFNRVEFRHEIETGITDRFQLAVYAADWHGEWGHSVDHGGWKYDDTAVEGIYRLVDPGTHFLGVAVYGEAQLGDQRAALESKLILQKNIGKLELAYNLSLEAVWEGKGYHDQAGEVSQALGASYEIRPSLLVGAELLHEIDLPDWHTGGTQSVYVGPNASYRWGRWWITATPQVQVTRNRGEPDFQMRVILGVSF
jgi:hypothetical protein